jgi:hypothetical protein
MAENRGSRRSTAFVPSQIPPVCAFLRLQNGPMRTLASQVGSILLHGRDTLAETKSRVDDDAGASASRQIVG